MTDGDIGRGPRDFLRDGGEMGAAMRGHDWAATALGDPADWPQSLKLVVRLMLATRHPMFVFWGPAHYCFYNDAYAPSLGPEKHTAILGQPGREAWAEIWDVIGPQIDYVMAGKGATWHANQRLPILRHGALQEVFWTYSYSPIEDGGSPGGVGGVLVVCSETTQQVVAERKLDAETQRLRAMFDQAPGFMCVLGGRDHVFQIVNRAYMALIGASDLEGKRVIDVLPEAAEQGFIALLDEVFDSGAPHVGHRQLLRLNTRGEDDPGIYIDFVYQPLKDADGTVTGIFCEGSDVTAAVIAEQALRESGERLRKLADHAPMMIWVTDETGYCTYLSRQWYEFTGQTEAEAIGYGWTTATHPDDQARAEAAFQAAVKARAPFRIEYRLRRADGNYRWAIDAASPRFEEDGSFQGHVGGVIDIHDRREAESALKLSEERFRAAVGAVSGVLWTNDSEGRMAGDQPGWAALTGQRRADYADYGWSDAVHPDDAQPTVDAWAKSVASRSIFEFEHRVRRRDGSWGHFAIRAVPVIEEDGSLREWVGVHTDITDQREAEARLRQFADHLEQRVSDELAKRSEAEEALRQSQKMEAVGQLTGGIAHDFNNMLAVVMGSLDLLERRLSSDDARARRYVEAAMEGARRAATLTQRLLAFSRQQPLQPKPINANRLVAGMSDLLSHSLGGEIRIETVLAAGLWQTMADPNQLENALLNLAVNARDAMPGGGTLTIETQNAHVDANYAGANLGVAAGQYVLIAVTDTGSGIPADVIDRVFDPFFTTKAVGKGTGLGLSQVYGFVKQSGGNVKIYSEAGQGTTIKIYLPRLFGDVADHLPEPASNHLPKGDPGELILIVEDEPEVRRFTTEALTELGYEVLAASGGAEALDLLAANTQIQLVFTDVIMPEMTGAELARRIREMRPGLPILFTTGYTRNAIVHNGKLDADVELLSKPFSLGDLARRVRQLLDAKALAGKR